MGEAAARAAGASPVVVGSLPDAADTTPDDTRRIAAQLAALAPDLLLVAGGDGTLRDVCAAVGTAVPVVGIPAGVKIHSPAFATGPRAAGDLAAAFLLATPSRRRTAPADVLDLDEDAYRRGEIAPRLFGEVAVPAGDRRLQARKEPSPASEAGAVAGAAEGVVRHLVGGRPLGAGARLHRPGRRRAPGDPDDAGGRGRRRRGSWRGAAGSAPRAAMSWRPTSARPSSSGSSPSGRPPSS